MLVYSESHIISLHFFYFGLFKSFAPKLIMKTQWQIF